MLIELAVRDLGVIADARVPLDSAMTALTGETGAGKTMVVEALELLTGARVDPSRVRPGSPEAVVEGLFVTANPDGTESEWVLRRVVPATGRSRCYLNGELSTAAKLAELSTGLLEIHGQHAQMSLVSPAAQREALDRYAGVDRSALDAARRRRKALQVELESLGGDDRTRRRHMDLLAHQIAEIEDVAPRDGEDEELGAEEDLLAGAIEHRDAALRACALVAEEGAAADLLAHAVALLGGRGPFDALCSRLTGLSAELSDCAAELRSLAETIEPDEERLDAVRGRRHALAELGRKYGDTAEEVLAFADSARVELEALEGLDERRTELSARIDDLRGVVLAESARIGEKRRGAAPRLAREVTEILAELALRGSVVELRIEDSEELPGAGEEVELRLSTDPGGEPAGLAKVASGGELSRVMLALRIVLSGGPPTMVFDEVDAGVGGAAAVAVGEALAGLGHRHQVLVVTHLAQVAAAAQHQVAVRKLSGDGRAVTALHPLSGEERVVEISRMLSGSPDSATAREHAVELLGAGGRR